MRAISIFILSIFFASSVFAGEKKTVKQIEDASNKVVAEVRTEKTVDKSALWSLSAYPAKDGYLPRNYQGVSPKKFWEFFKGKVSAIQKGDLETQEEFDLRKTDVDTVLFPVKESDLYAFWKPDIIVWYDAIGQYYAFRSKDDQVFCDEISLDWNTCKIDTVENSHTAYLGSFARGSATVKRSKTTEFSLAIRKTNPFFQSPLLVRDITKMGFDHLVRFPPEKAMKLKGNKIGVLFLGSVTSAEIIAGKSNISPPTFEDPTDTVIQEEAIPFDLKKIVFYVVETGKILEVKDLQP